MMPLAHWSLLSRSSSIVRSSHCVAVTKSGVLVTYGGELTPRVPVDNEQNVQNGALKGSVHTLDLQKKQSDHLNGWETASPAVATHSGFLPDARVGATTVFEDGGLYLWGGRGGINMAPLQGDQTGIFRGKICFDGGASLTRNISWEFLPASNPSEAPVPTSYHSVVSHQVRTSVTSTPFVISSLQAIIFAREIYIYTQAALRRVVCQLCTHSISQATLGKSLLQPRILLEEERLLQ